MTTFDAQACRDLLAEIRALAEITTYAAAQSTYEINSATLETVATMIEERAAAAVKLLDAQA